MYFGTYPLLELLQTLRLSLTKPFLYFHIFMGISPTNLQYDRRDTAATRRLTDAALFFDSLQFGQYWIGLFFVGAWAFRRRRRWYAT
jgi:hypothetical protein